MSALRNERSPRAFEEIITQLENLIVENQFKAGQRLPAERELKKMFRTSRSTIREALRVLEQTGLIEIRVGSRGGSYVKSVRGEQIGLGITQLIRFGQVSFSQITDFRLGVEVTAVQMAVRNATAGDVRSLKTLVAELKVEFKKGSANCRKFFIAESELHLAILSMTRNPLYESMLPIIHSNLWKYHDMLPYEEHVLARAYRDWSELLETFENRDVLRAARIITSHLLEYHRYLEDFFRSNQIDEHTIAKRLFEGMPAGEAAPTQRLRLPAIGEDT
jgi:DNA-binding FadR family transcriptional regulator